MRSAAPIGVTTAWDAPRRSFGGQSSGESATRPSQAFALWIMLVVCARHVPQLALFLPREPVEPASVEALRLLYFALTGALEAALVREDGGCAHHPSPREPA